MLVGHLLESLHPGPDLHEITGFNLDICIAVGSKLPYIRYINAEVVILFLYHDHVYVPVYNTLQS